MKCEMTSRGDIRITPENATERYALQAWSDSKSSGLSSATFIVDLTPPPMAPAMPCNPQHIKEF